MKTLHKLPSYPIVPHNQKMNFGPLLDSVDNYMQLMKYGNQGHSQDITCFHCCSTWVLKMSSFANKKNLSTFNYYGKLATSHNEMISKAKATPKNITEYLPIDLSQNQRFVLDPNMKKINMNLVFDFNGQFNHFTTISHFYSILLFEIKLIGSLHGMQMLKEPIDFKVKGYDIDKSIRNVLNCNGVSLSDIILRNQMVTVFEATVFSNIQCSFSVEFSISNYNLDKYYLEANQFCFENQSNNNISQYGIVITKLKIVYYLPLCVFSYQNRKQITQKHFQNPVPQPQLNEAINSFIYVDCTSHTGAHFQSMINDNINNKKIQNYDCKVNKKKMKISYINKHLNKAFIRKCNWHLFMTYTTPFILEKEDLKIKEILKGFIKPSLFGILCIFKLDKNNYSEVTYYPSLSSIYIEKKAKSSPDNEVKSSSSNSSSKSTLVLNSKLPSNESLNLDESYQTNHSTTLDDNVSSSRKKILFYSEQVKEIYNTPIFNDQLNAFFHFDKKKETLTLGDITSESYYSITWTPSKIVDSNAQDSKNRNLTSFKVFYKFKEKNVSNKGKFQPVIGIIEKTVRHQTIDSFSQDLSDFWFINDVCNKSEDPQTREYYLNSKVSFSSLKENGCKYEFKEHQELEHL